MLNLKAGQAIVKKAKEKLQPLMSQTVAIKLTHGRDVHDVTVPCFMSFGQLKETASAVTRVPIQHLKLNFKGRDRGDSDTLAGAGVKNGAKVFVGESEAHRAQVAAEQAAQQAAVPQQPHGQSPVAAAPEQRAEWETFGGGPGGGFAATPQGLRAPPPTPVPLPKPQLPQSDTERAVDAIGRVAQQVDEIQGRVQGVASRGSAQQDAAALVEALTQKLLLLDSIEVTAESRQLRKDQINRINALCDQLEHLKMNGNGLGSFRQ